MITTVDCSLSNLNSKRKIYDVFGFPKSARNTSYKFEENYCFSYYKKQKSKKDRRNQSDRIKKYLTFDKGPSKQVLSIPPEEDSKNYRVITKFKDGSEWLKKAQKKFARIVGKKLGSISYLQSTLKKTSYAKNGNKHAGTPKYFYILDLKDFFTQISSDEVKKTIKKYLSVDGDVATLYSKMLTSPSNESSTLFVLGQGLPSSPLLAFLCNMSLFEYINTLSIANGICFTIYVDDITFSSDNPIPQEFIDKIMGLLKGNHLKVNKKKIHKPKKENTKLITGVCILKDGTTTIARKKHEELFCLYEYITKNINKENYEFDDFLDLYNSYIKFSGNYIHLCEVQYNGDLGPKATNFVHNKYSLLYKKLLPFFKIGAAKKDSKFKYSINNIKKEEDLDFLKCRFDDFIDNRGKLISYFKEVKKRRSILKYSK